MLAFWWHWLRHPLRCVHSHIGATFTADTYLCKKCDAAWEVGTRHYAHRDLFGRVKRCSTVTYRRLDPEEVKELKQFREEVAKDVDTL